jgi:hypothetical protein
VKRFAGLADDFDHLRLAEEFRNPCSAKFFAPKRYAPEWEKNDVSKDCETPGVTLDPQKLKINAASAEAQHLLIVEVFVGEGFEQQRESIADFPRVWHIVNPFDFTTVRDNNIISIFTKNVNVAELKNKLALT